MKRIGCPINTNFNVGKFKCLICGMQFTKPDEREAHQIKIHKKGQKIPPLILNKSTPSTAIKPISPPTTAQETVLVDGEKYDPVESVNPIDMLYVLYLKSVAELSGGRRKSLTYAMNKSDFIASDVWKKVDISFLAEESQARLIARASNQIIDKNNTKNS